MFPCQEKVFCPLFFCFEKNTFFGLNTTIKTSGNKTMYVLYVQEVLTIFYRDLPYKMDETFSTHSRILNQFFKITFGQRVKSTCDISGHCCPRYPAKSLLRCFGDATVHLYRLVSFLTMAPIQMVTHKQVRKSGAISII